jgi:putative nucleotidyltransferase with HDIG domain
MIANTAFLAKLEAIRNLPTLPVVVQKVRQTVGDPNSDAAKLATIIEDDPAMMTRILKVVNSAFYAGREPVTSVQMAVARMGMRAVGNIAMSTAVFSSFGKSPQGGFDREEFWRHSICTGIAAAVVYDSAKNALSSRFTKDVLHLAGLLHDIGKIVFDQFFHDEFRKALEMSAMQMISLADAECRVTGVNHMEVGAWLGEKWHLNEDLLQVIKWHQDPNAAEAKYWDMVALVHTANYICNQEKIGNSGNNVPSFLPHVWKRMGLGVGDIPAVVDRVNEESKQSAILMALT